MLYLSLYFKQHRERYYELLDAVRREGDWESWIEFFADGVAETADGAVSTARRLLDLARADRDRVQRLGRSAGSAAIVHDALQRIPITTIARLAKKSKLTLPTVAKALGVLADLGVVREVTGKERHRVYRYEQFMSILSEGTEPL